MSKQLAAYLARIGLEDRISADPAGLAAVQAAQRRTIAFENLDVMQGRLIEIGREAVFAKLVGERRGGYCFEHNRLLADMLGEMGLASRPLLARPLLGNSPEPMPRTHCLLLLEIGGASWIADGGFGGAFCPPLPLFEGVVTTSEDGASHRLRRLGEAGSLPGEWLLERRGPGDAQGAADWAAQFAFDLAEVAPSDLAMGNHWSCTHPSARFVNEQVVTLCLPDGFVSMVDSRFSLHRAGLPADRREIGSAAEYGAVLNEVFGLALPAENVAHLPLFA